MLKIIKKVFDSSNINWTENIMKNGYLLARQEVYVSDLYHSVGYITLSTIYDILGLPQTKQGFTYGRVVDHKSLSWEAPIFTFVRNYDDLDSISYELTFFMDDDFIDKLDIPDE